MTSVTQPIAIIGAAGRFPEAATLEEFEHNLASGRDSVRPIGPHRVATTSLDPRLEYQSFGHLDQIDVFDHAYFGISLREAELMDPTHRIALQLVATAIERAGYRRSVLSGTQTGVYVAGGRPEYFRLLQKAEPLALLGNLGSALAGRLAYHFGFEGPSITVDTGCSSSLVALHYACRALNDNDIDVAVVGGVSVKVFVEPKDAQLNFGGIMSPAGKCRAFEARADGTSDGEGGAFLILKRQVDAQRDHDLIEGLVLGTAINQNGSRSTALAAPSPRAQRDVIRAAWNRAGVKPGRLTYVEAHGSGTRLGDVIEAQAIADAFNELGPEDGWRVVGSVKTNIGHLGSAAGIAGVVKAVASVRSGLFFPTVHFKTPNPLIEFERLRLRVSSELEVWEALDCPRQAGVSSFGLTGVNAHVVVQEPPPPTPTATPTANRFVVKLSARTRPALRQYVTEVAAAVTEHKCSFDDIVAVLDAGRDDHSHRLAVVATSPEELAAAARRSLERFDDESIPPVVIRTPARLVFVLPGRTPSATATANQLAVLRSIEAAGVHRTAVVGVGAGNIAAAVLDGRIREDGVNDAVISLGTPAEVDPLELRRVVAELLNGGPCVFVVVGEDPTLRAELDRLAAELPQLRTVHIAASLTTTSAEEFVARLYELGVTVDWSMAAPALRGVRPLLPVHPFEGVRCWCRPKGDVVPFTNLWPGESTLPPMELPEPELRSHDAIPDEATPTMGRLSVVWSTALKAPTLDPSSDYFDLGGNSLTALEVIDGVEAAFGIRLSLEVLYDHSTLGDLAQFVDDELSRPADERSSRIIDDLPVRRIDRTPRLPMSFGQQRLWFLEKLTPGTGAYNIPIDLHLEGHLRRDALEEALRALVRRHEVLRSRFVDEDGVPHVEIFDDATPSIRYVDLAGRDDTEAALRAEVVADASMPFDLSVGPLFRSLLVRLSETRHVLLLTVHHSVDDGWSPAIFAEEFSEQYSAYCEGRRPELAELPIQYVDYAHWQNEWLRGDVMTKQLLFWTHLLDGVDALELPCDRPRPARQTLRGDLLRFAIPADLAQRLRALAAESKSTLFMTILAGLNVLLARYSGQEDILVATPTAGRNRSETRHLIGFFNNTVVLRTKLAGDPSFRELLAHERRVVLEALANQDLPYEKIVEAVQPNRDLSRETLFQVVYIHNRIPALDYQLPGLRVGPSAMGSYESSLTGGLSPGTAKCDLTLIVRDVEGMEELPAALEYSTDLFDESTVRRMKEHLLVLLDGIVTDPDLPIRHLPLLPEHERKGLLTRHTEAVEWLPERIQRSIAHRATETPNGTAVHDGNVTTTYHQLAEAQHTIASVLRNDFELGVGKRVGIYLDRGADAVASILAALEIGAAFVPLDPEYPLERLRFIANDSEVSAIVTTRAAADRLAGWGFPLVCTDELPTRSVGPVAVDVPIDALAYIIYTSGSTGSPKGVAVSHRALMDQLDAMMPIVGIEPDDVVLGGSALSFDPSLIEILMTLRAGARLEVVRRAQLLQPGALGALIDQSGATVLQATPTTWRLLLRSGWQGSKRLRAFVGGEVLTPALAEELRSLTASVTNLYGPTEATVWSTAWPVEGEIGPTVPIGTPIERKVVYVVDAGLDLVPVGVPGEIVIGGDGLAAGYWNRPELTADRFVHDPWGSPTARMYRTGDRGRWRADGQLEFLGRVDDQVKVRGIRIELGEIEATAEALDTVSEATAVLVGHEDDAKVVLHVVPAVAATIREDEIRTALRERLPDAMIPHSIVAASSLPRTPSRKVDRKLLAADVSVSQPSHGIVSPRDPFELKLCQLWAEVLDRSEVGVHDNFFELGGHSLLAVQLLARLEDMVGSELPLAMLFEGPTVAQVAAVLRGGLRSPSRSVVSIRSGHSTTLALAHPAGGNVLCYYDLARCLPDGVDVYGLQAVGLDGLAPPLKTIPAMAERYVEELLLVASREPLVLGGWSMGGLIALEMAQLLVGEGAAPPALVLIDAALTLPERPVYLDDADHLAHLLLNTFGVKVPAEVLSSGDSEVRLRSVVEVAEAAEAVPAGVDLTDVQRFLELLRTNEHAVTAYEPSPYKGNALLIRAVTASGDEPDDLGWESLVSRLDIATVAGDHFTIMTERAADVAVAITQALALASKGGSL